ncbi:DUF771 domain-containing protein [Streptococcus suis]|uniref:DUF771 domain-containing protein n=1 Tax=Streptococcus suis TaxID=1307 RepID=UPI0023D86663|nr:DUF771 domain-containing protein [Streptococcus suis]
MDTITVQLENIVIKLPETHLIIAKDDYQKLQERASKGQYWTLSDVLSLLSVSRPWLLDNVLYKPEIRSQIDIDRNTEGFVKYPQNQGERYFFLASKTKEYFEKNFKDIFK